MLPMDRTSLAFLLLISELLALACVMQGLLSTPSNLHTTTNITKHGCQKKCGNVTIPYPFGIGDDCSMAYEYNITCDSTGGTTSAQSDILGTIVNISDTQVHITVGPVARSCISEEAGGQGAGNLDLTGLPYALSPMSNKFVVTGCYHYGLLEIQTKGWHHQVLSCVALCTKESDLHDGTCSGIGCCQTLLPMAIQKFNTSFGKIDYEGNISAGNCSFGFVVEKSRFNFHGAIDLQDPNFDDRVENLPLVLDWFVANNTCRVAKRNLTTYACQKNAVCVNVDPSWSIKGYRCECRTGFEGNPYLSPGCIDINECTRPDKPCPHICKNIEGDYYCQCPSGYEGDGTNCSPEGPNIPKSAIALGIGLGLGTVLFLLSLAWLVIVARRRKKLTERAKNYKRNGGLLLEQQMSSEKGSIEKTKVFSVDELNQATDYFSANRILGHGGQGTVYKGMLTDGSIVAIKKSKKIDDRQLDQFINELVILSQINHRNIVKLLGCCLETEVPLLVFEYVPNGTVSSLIHQPSKDFPVTWKMRMQIAVDVAGALNYMHSASSKPVFHRDVKTSNMLLDEKYRAKLSDFGTSRAISIDQTHVSTCVQGTFGYLDPEYFRSSQFTEKSDVYSFGVVLVELLTGQKAIRSSDGESLVSWFLKTMEISNLDNNLAAEVAKEGGKEVYAFANLAKDCLDIDIKRRPTMRKVATALEAISGYEDGSVVSESSQLEQVHQASLETFTEIISDDQMPPTLEDLSIHSN